MIEFTETFPQYVDFGAGFRTGYTQRSAWWKWARREAVKAGGTIEVVETTVFS
jgi:hypothetical protein